MKKTLFLSLLGLCSVFIFSSCEEREDIKEQELNKNEGSTRSYNPYIFGETTVYEGDTHEYYLQNAWEFTDVEWMSDNGIKLTSSGYSALYLFETAGSTRITTYFVHKDNYWYESSAYINVTVLPFDIEGALNNVTILGSREPEVNTEKAYRLSIPSRMMTLNDITWTLDGISVGWSEIYYHVFTFPGTYKLECSGTLSTPDIPSIPFSKSINIVVPGAVPMYINGDNYVETQNQYSYSVDYPSPYPNQIEWDIPAGVQYIYSNNNKTVQLKFSEAGTFEIKCRAVHDGYATGWEIKTIKVFNAIENNRWHVLEPYIENNGSLIYYVVFRATKPYTCESLYITCLYNGAYDGYYASENWEWKYDGWSGKYHPATVESQYGSVNMLLDIHNGSPYTKTIKAGELFVTRATHSGFDSSKSLDDIEYIIFNVYDNLNGTRTRYNDLCDFEY